MFASGYSTKGILRWQLNDLPLTHMRQRQRRHRRRRRRRRQRRTSGWFWRQKCSEFISLCFKPLTSQPRIEINSLSLSYTHTLSLYLSPTHTYIHPRTHTQTHPLSLPNQPTNSLPLSYFPLPIRAVRGDLLCLVLAVLTGKNSS